MRWLWIWPWRLRPNASAYETHGLMFAVSFGFDLGMYIESRGYACHKMRLSQLAILLYVQLFQVLWYAATVQYSTFDSEKNEMTQVAAEPVWYGWPDHLLIHVPGESKLGSIESTWESSAVSAISDVPGHIVFHKWSAGSITLLRNSISFGAGFRKGQWSSTHRKRSKAVCSITLPYSCWKDEDKDRQLGWEVEVEGMVRWVKPPRFMLAQWPTPCCELVAGRL